MNCAACGHENRPGRKFCAECGAALALACAGCGTPYEAGEKFCGECGAALGSATPRRTAPETPRVEPGPGTAGGGRPTRDAGARKIVTIVFADLVGSTALHERVDAESARRLMDRYYLALRRAVEAQGGTVVKLLGDGVMAAFGLDRVAEDDALRAVRAAAAMQDAFRGLVRAEGAALGSVGLRVAVNTGEVVVTGAADDVIGDPVNVAARLQEQGRDGDVVLGETTHRLVATRVTLAPLGSITLKGRAESVAAHRLVSLDPPAGAAAAPFVGRDAELARLESAFDAAVTTPATRLAVLVGSPGLGKSRLIDELARRHADDATILAAHCDAAGGATFAPLAQALRRFLGLTEDATGAPLRTAVAAVLANGADDGERTRIAAGIDGLLTGAPTSPEETFFVVRRFLAGLAAARPVVLVVDDLHWAEPLLLDLVEHLVQWGSGVRLFVLVGARPELRELRSSLVTPGGIVGDVVMLGGLDAGAAMRLAAGVIGAADLPAAVAAKVLATSEGNPLFVGELVRMLVQEGALTREGDRWTAGASLAALEMPPTIHALLAARIERLRPEERTVLERAAVVGRHFSRSAVAALLGRRGAPSDARDTSDLDARLESLRRSELIERDTGWLLGEPALRFHHVLIRDAAYRRLLKGTRAELHAELADWIEARVGDAPEHDETIGRHLEQAHQLLRELGPLDAAAVALGERAARRLAAAGRRALARDDVSLAAGLLGRALARLGEAAPERADLVLDWCEALLAAGDVGPAADAIAELDRIANEAANHVARGATAGAPATGTEAGDAARDGRTDARRLRAWHTCFAGQLTVLTAPEALNATAEQVGAAALELAQLDDAAGEAKAHFVHAQALARLGKIGACEAALDHALAAARRAGDRRRANAILAGAPLAALWGPSPVTRASGRCLDVVRVLRITQGAPAVEAVALSCQGVLEALRGRTEAARRMLASSRTMVEELGIAHRLYETEVFAGRVDLLEGDAAAAERSLRAGYEGLRDLGLGIDAARAAALLGRALLAQDRAAEAETLSHESELLAGDDLQAAIAWRGVRAEALARRGEHAAAITFAEAAVAIAAATDALLDHADARLALAAALHAGGRGRDAEAEARRAFELWEAKGATLLVERTRRADAPVAAADPAPQPHGASAMRRGVTPNRATAALVAFNAAMAAPDFAAFRAQMSEDYEEIDHPTGTSYGRDANVAALELLMRSRDARCRSEPLATLGDALVLVRRRVSASATGGGRFDVGAYEQDAYTVAEVDGLGRWCRHEVFGGDRLGDALVRFYERHAELLPEGAEQTRAAGMARSLAPTHGRIDLDRLRTAYDPALRCVDHRVFATWAASSAEEMVRHYALQLELAPDFAGHYDEVLGANADVVATRMSFFGTGRDSGGHFENHVTTVFKCGADGRLTRVDIFEGEQTAKALARFDALSGTASERDPGPAPRRARPLRAPRPNAVTRVSAEFEAIIAARDFDGLETFFAEDAECVDHLTGSAYRADGMRTGMHLLMCSPDAHLRFVPLATLGTSWGLVRRELSASGMVAGRFDVGAYELAGVAIFGTDDRGRLRHVELFADEHLGAAVVRLYERYAESLHDAAEATRARGVARSLAAFDGPVDFEGVGNANAPAVEVEDHRVLGTWSARGRAQWMVHWRGQFALADESRGRYDEILALAPAAILAHQTFSGSGRTSGGAFENLALVLHGFDADGLIARTELFEPEHVAAALARFDALAGAGAEALPVRDGARPPRRLQGNAASRTLAAVEAAFTRRDLAAIDALLGDSLETIEHPTATRYGREGQIESSRRMMRLPDLDVRIEPLATLGDELCLARRVVTASGTAGGRFDVGPFEIESIVVTAVDGAGRLASSEVFARDRLCQAIARFCTIYAESLPDGPERTRSEGIASAHAVMGESLDADRIQSLFTASYVCVDHRSLGTWSAEGREDWLRHWREQANLTTGFARRDEDILAFTPAVNVMRHAYFGISRASGGPFENVILCVNVFDDAGRNSRVEIFEPDQEAAALARFDEVIAAEASCTTTRRRVRANTATRSLERFRAIVDARDRDALGDVFAESLHFTHHPTAATYGRREMLATWRSILRAEKVTMRTETLASLGDVLALERHFLSIEGLREDHVAAFGPSELEEITVIEVDERGRWRRVELFAPEHLADAADRLRERYAELLPAGPDRDRAAAIARTAAAAHRGSTDPGAIASVCAPRIEAVDHRLVGFGALRGRDAMVSAARALLDLSEDVRWRDDDVLALSEHASVIRSTQRGRDRATGGAWERPLCTLMVHGADGLLVRWESFEPEQEAEALARFDELVGPARNPAATPECGAFFANAATRALDRVAEVTAARDWEGLADTCAASLRFDDRRPLFRMQLPKEGFLAQHRVLFDVPNARWDMRTIATRGERLTLSQILLQGDVAGGGGALEIDHRGVIEVDDNGRMTAIVLFEPADLDAAYAELDARWQAVEAASHPRVAAYQRAFTRGLADRDWSALASLHAPSLVAVDHRLVGWGELHGPDAYVGALRAMVDLAPDAEGRLDHLRTTEHGLLAAVVWVGTRDGGAFESPFLWVVELDETGRARRLDFYDPHHAERARARFAELDPSTSRAGARRIAPGATADRSAPQTALRASPGRPRDPLAALVKPTLVTAVMERWRAAYDVGFETGRWEAMRPLFAPGFVFDDRRRLVLLRGDIELMLASLRERAASGARAEWTVVGAAGERIMIGRMLWSGGPPDGRFEIEYLGVIEVDEAGLVVANVLYDLDDAPAARREAWTRWAAIDPTVTEWVQTVAEAGPAFDARDRARVRALFADDLVVEDHRWTGFGRTEGAEAYVDSLVALWELTANQRVEFGRFWPVVGRHGAITSIRREGTLSGGGGSFESDYLFLFVAPHGRITRIELFEVADLERALARFEELRPDPLRIPPNAATRAIDRRTAAFEARDWDALRALCDEALVFEDRRRIARTIGDRETFVASNRLVGDVGAHVVREVLATAGERLALERARITAGEAGAEIEVETLVVSEIDADGRLAAIVFFEPDDDRAASRTLAERHLALTRPAALPRLAALFDADGDLARLRAALPDDFVFHDHRRTGLGRLDGPDAYVASVAALHELAPDAIVGQPLYFLADEPHGTLTIARSFGTLANGGAYESVYVMIMRYGPDGTIGGELFELEHLDAARARFADLRG